MNTKQKLAATLKSFQILDSRSGNVVAPPFKREGTDTYFDYSIHENIIEITVTSVTFNKNFYYQLVSKSKYEFEGKSADEIEYNDIVSSVTEMAQYCLKKHSNIFRQF